MGIDDDARAMLFIVLIVIFLIDSIFNVLLVIKKLHKEISNKTNPTVRRVRKTTGLLIRR